MFQGELLISRGIHLTNKLIDALKRRNIFELQIINSYIETPVSKSRSTPCTFFFENIDDGEIGLQQLLHLHSVSEPDKAFRFGRVNDRPIGAALKLRINRCIFQTGLNCIK